MAMRNPQANKQSNVIEDTVEKYLTKYPDSIFNV